MPSLSPLVSTSEQVHIPFALFPSNVGYLALRWLYQQCILLYLGIALAFLAAPRNRQYNHALSRNPHCAESAGVTKIIVRHRLASLLHSTGTMTFLRDLSASATHRLSLNPRFLTRGL